MSLYEQHEYDDDGDETFFCGSCGKEISQITYINGDVCHTCENGE